jgi:sugar phosphate isomerase/epimerase
MILLILFYNVLDYKSYIDIYHERIKAFHVKDAEFNPTGKQGVYGGFQGWDRSGWPLSVH